MCNKKLRLMTAVIITSSVLMFSGCGKNDSTTEPVISDAVEETEPIEEVEETDEIVDPADTEDNSENTVESDNDSSNENSSIGGEDTKTDEEIEAELEETENVVINEEGHRIVDGIDYDNDNNGQGWDINGEHFDTWGEYLNAIDEKLSGIETEEEFEWLTPDQGPLTPNN